MLAKHNMLAPPGWAKARPPCSRLCNLEEQVLKCSIFCEADAAQRLSSNSDAPVLAG